MEGFWIAHRATGHQSSRNTSLSRRLRGCSPGSSLERSPHTSVAHPRSTTSSARGHCAPSQCSQPGQLPSQSCQTGSHRGFCQGARQRVMAVHVRDSQGALRRRTARQRHCFLGSGRAGTSVLSCASARAFASWGP